MNSRYARRRSLSSRYTPPRESIEPLRSAPLRSQATSFDTPEPSSREYWTESSPSPSPSLPSQEHSSSGCCVRLNLPLIVGADSSEPLLVQLCIHSSWTPSPNHAIHLARDSAILSPASIHDPPHVEIDYPVRDLLSPRTEQESQDVPESDRRLWLDSPEHPSRPCPLVLAAFVLLPITYIFAAITGCISHPTWVNVSSTNTTYSPTIWRPIQALHTTYEDSLLPLFTPFEIPSPITPLRPSKIHEAVQIKLEHVSRGLASWRGSSFHGPNPSLEVRAEGLIDEFRALQEDYHTLYTQGSQYLCASLAAVLGNITDTENKKETVQLIANFWDHTQESNEMLIEHLIVMQRRMECLSNMGEFLDDVEQALQQHRNKYSFNNWIENTLDAISFTRSDVLTLAQHIPPLISKAVTHLTAQRAHVGQYSTLWKMRAINMAEESTVCEFSTDQPLSWWSSWVLGYRTSVQVMEDMDERDLGLLHDTIKRGGMVGWLLMYGTEVEKRYREARPKRPARRWY